MKNDRLQVYMPQVKECLNLYKKIMRNKNGPRVHRSNKHSRIQCLKKGIEMLTRYLFYFKFFIYTELV